VLNVISQHSISHALDISRITHLGTGVVIWWHAPWLSAAPPRYLHAGGLKLIWAYWVTGGMTLDLRYQTYTDAIPATYLYHSRPAPSEPHHPAPLRIANLACLSAQSCLLYGKGRGYAVSQTKLAILHSSTTLHKVALCAIAVAYQQRYESTGDTGTPLATVRYAFDKLSLHRTTHPM
jgi:hypothetical protein